MICGGLSSVICIYNSFHRVVKLKHSLTYISYMTYFVAAKFYNINYIKYRVCSLYNTDIGILTSHGGIE